MASTKLINRYAITLLDIAVEKKIEDKIFSDAGHFLKICHENRDFSNLLKNPTFAAKLKLIIIRQILSGRFDPVFISFIQIVINHNREMFLKDIFTEYIHLFKQKEGIIEAEIITATAIDNEFLLKFTEVVKKYSGYPKVELTNKVNEKIIGGFIIHFEDKILNASVSDQLKKTRLNIK